MIYVEDEGGRGFCPWLGAALSKAECQGRSHPTNGHVLLFLRPPAAKLFGREFVSPDFMFMGLLFEFAHTG